MRPEGWDNPHKGYKDVIGDPDFDDKVMRIQFKAYEAGADAMLEGLEYGDYFIRVTDKAVTMPGFEATVDDTVRGAGDGLWVFIPEEKG